MALYPSIIPLILAFHILRCRYLDTTGDESSARYYVKEEDEIVSAGVVVGIAGFQRTTG
jgi:hypothetical protein